MAQDPRRLVAQGYDVIAERYAAWDADVAGGAKSKYVEITRRLVPPGGRILDLGCATGHHVTRHLATDYEVVGVDISGRSASIAKRTVPRAHFIVGDMAAMAFRLGSFDGVVAFYSMIHVPRTEHAALLAAIGSWLRPGGTLVVTLAAGQGEDGQGTLLGVPMYWSGWDGQTSLGLIRAAGLTIVGAREEAEDEHGAIVRHLWVVAARPSAGPCRPSPGGEGLPPVSEPARR